MLGSLIIGADGVRQQDIDQVTSAHQLGPMIVTEEDKARALVKAGLAPQDAPPAAPASGSLGAPDKGLTVREVIQQLKDNPASVGAILKAEAERMTQGVSARASVLKAGRAVAATRGDDELVAGVDALLAEMSPEE